MLANKTLINIPHHKMAYFAQIWAHIKEFQVNSKKFTQIRTIS